MQLVIKKPDGDERFEVPENFTYRELKTVRQITGLRPGEFEEALAAGDSDFIIALAVISGARSGVQVDPEDLLDLEIGAIELEGDEPDPTAGADAQEAPETTLAAGGDQPS